MELRLCSSTMKIIKNYDQRAPGVTLLTHSRCSPRTLFKASLEMASRILHERYFGGHTGSLMSNLIGPHTLSSTTSVSISPTHFFMIDFNHHIPHNELDRRPPPTPLQKQRTPKLHRRKTASALCQSQNTTSKWTDAVFALQSAQFRTRLA